MARRRNYYRVVSRVNVTDEARMIDAIQWYPYFLRSVELRPYFDEIVKESSKDPLKLLTLISIKSYTHGFEYPFVQEYPRIIEVLIDFLNSGRRIVWPPRGHPRLSRVEIEEIGLAVDDLISPESVGGKKMSFTQACKTVAEREIGGIHRSPDQIRNIFNKIDNVYEFVLPNGGVLKSADLTIPKKTVQRV